MLDKRISLKSFDGIAEATEHLYGEVLSASEGEDLGQQLKKAEVAAKVLEQARNNLVDKSKYQAALNALEGVKPATGREKRTSDPFPNVVPMSKTG